MAEVVRLRISMAALREAEPIAGTLATVTVEMLALYRLVQAVDAAERFTTALDDLPFSVLPTADIKPGLVEAAADLADALGYFDFNREEA